MWGARQASAVAIVLPEEKDKGHGTRDKGATGTVLLRCHPGEARVRFSGLMCVGERAPASSVNES